MTVGEAIGTVVTFLVCPCGRTQIAFFPDGLPDGDSECPDCHGMTAEKVGPPLMGLN